MDIWQTDKLILFVAFFVPGFMAQQIYSLFVGIDSDDVTKRLPSIIGYSAIHYAFAGWPLLVLHDNVFRAIAAYFIVLVLPIFWTPVVLLIRDWENWSKVFLSTKFPGINFVGIVEAALTPEATVWDRVMDNQDRWVRIRLKSGRFVGGFYGRGSGASTYPSDEEIFVSDAFEIDTDGNFTKEILPRTGVLVRGSEIETLELIPLQKEP